jgi:hypothetical protein
MTCSSQIRLSTEQCWSQENEDLDLANSCALVVPATLVLLTVCAKLGTDVRS